MNISKLSRRNYSYGDTPIESLNNLTQYLDGPNIYMKRDDYLGLTGGGNKTRKLEFLVADALKNGADTLITCGAVQSNHCRLSLSAAKKEKLKCHLVLEERVPGSYDPQSSGNNFLYQLLGADSITVVPGKSNMQLEMEEVADQVRSEGGKPYIIPGGGSNEVGATGYVACAQEIMSQMYKQSLSFDYIVCASGSAGTHAGLLTGLHGNNFDIPVIGISVNRKKEEQEDIVFNLTRKTTDFLNVKHSFDQNAVTVYDEYVGEGYSLPTKGMKEAVRILSQEEGILLDPVYTGKTMAGFIDLIREGHFNKNDNVLFLHTGGAPSLFAYTSLFQDNPK